MLINLNDRFVIVISTLVVLIFLIYTKQCYTAFFMNERTFLFIHFKFGSLAFLYREWGPFHLVYTKVIRFLTKLRNCDYVLR